MAGGLGAVWGWGMERANLWNFRVKNAGFYAFYCEKLYLWPETETRAA